MTTYNLFFSPCDGTRRIAELCARSLDDEALDIDITTGPAGLTALGPQDTVIAAAPVYGGRVAGTAIERIRNLQGNGARAVALVAFGNRAFEDALLELADTLTAQGFRVVSAGAFVTPHVYHEEVAQDRPDACDEQQIRQFALQTAQLLSARGTGPIELPGTRPYREFAAPRVTPDFHADRCVRCGLCARACPTGAIDPNDPAQSQAGVCILCMRCISQCAYEARTLPTAMAQFLRQKLSPLAGVRHSNAVFFADTAP